MALARVSDVLNEAVRLHSAGRLEDAEALYRQVLAQQPDNVDALHLLGVLTNQEGDPAVAIDLISRAIAMRPGVAGMHANLGTVLREAGRGEESASHLLKAVELEPQNGGFRLALGQALVATGAFAEALEAYQRAIDLNPSSAPAHAETGNLLHALGRGQEALRHLWRAVQLSPGDAPLCTRLGVLCIAQGRVAEAVACFRHAIATDPTLATAHAELAGALEFECAGEEAIAEYRTALRLDPRMEKAHGFMLYALLRQPGVSPEEIYAEHARWGEVHARPLERFIRPHANDRDPERRLRVAYVGPFFRQHVMNPFIEPILRSHDPAGFEVYCYSDVLRGDAVTERLKGHVDHWRDTAALDDARLAELIREDRIDIVFDPCGHLGGNRLQALARKPAPVQMTWLGYQATTGMSAMDYFVSDDYTDPPGATDRFYTEKVLRLPDLFWTWDPPADAPDVTPLPALASGQVTFGSFNHIAKINRPLVHLWCRILQGIPGSRLVILASDDQGSAVRRVAEWFAEGGVDSARLRVVPRRPRLEYLRLMTDVDIALDSFPFNGHTTTLECLWMGIPVVHRSGETFVQRYGAGPLRSLGLEDFVTAGEEQYVAKAVEAARDLEALAALRRELRGRFAKSLVTDHVRFTRRLEAAYRKAWAEWCAGAERERT